MQPNRKKELLLILKIHQYPLNEFAAQTLTLPKQARILSASAQGFSIVMYAAAETETIEQDNYEVLVLATEQSLPKEVADYTFLSTVLFNGLEVYHVFYKVA